MFTSKKQLIGNLLLLPFMLSAVTIISYLFYSLVDDFVKYSVAIVIGLNINRLTIVGGIILFMTVAGIIVLVIDGIQKND